MCFKIHKRSFLYHIFHPSLLRRNKRKDRLAVTNIIGMARPKYREKKKPFIGKYDKTFMDSVLDAMFRFVIEVYRRCIICKFLFNVAMNIKQT